MAGDRLSGRAKVHECLRVCGDIVFIEEFAKTVVVKMFPPGGLVTVKLSAFDDHRGRTGQFPIGNQLHQTKRKRRLADRPQICISRPAGRFCQYEFRIKMTQSFDFEIELNIQFIVAFDDGKIMIIEDRITFAYIAVFHNRP